VRLAASFPVATDSTNRQSVCASNGLTVSLADLAVRSTGGLPRREWRKNLSLSGFATV
jgi:hypothetical protein